MSMSNKRAQKIEKQIKVDRKIFNKLRSMAVISNRITDMLKGTNSHEDIVLSSLYMCLNSSLHGLLERHKETEF